MNNKLLGALLLAVVLGGMAWKISSDKAPQTEVTRSALTAGLLDRLNDVTRIELKGANGSTTLKRAQDRWTVANRDDFPAEPAAVKRLLLGLADLQIVEAKTRLPESYARIGVADPGEGSDSLAVELYGAKDDKLLSLIVGHKREGGQTSQRYVRRAGEAQSYLVNGKVEASADPITWLDARIVDVDTGRVKQVVIAPADGARIAIAKHKPKDNFFELVDVPAGKVPRSKALVSSLGAVLLDLRFNSVASAAKVTTATPVRQTTVQTFDGLVARIDEFEADGKTYARFDFAYDAGIVDAEAVKDIAPAAGDAPPIPGAEADKPAASESATKENVEQEATRLKARTAGWVYELPDYKMRMLGKRLDDLVQAPGKDDGKQSPAAP